MTNAVYMIPQWDERYENSRSRKVKDLQWVPVPNSHDGEGYSRVMAHPMAAQIFAAWILILEVASKCRRRGYLERDNGQPHTPESLALKTRGDAEWFRIALEYLSSEDVGWLRLTSECQQGTSTVPPDYHPSAEEGNGREKKEGKERMEPADIASALVDDFIDISACKRWIESGNAISKACTEVEEFIRAHPGYPPGWWRDWVRDLKTRLPVAWPRKYGGDGSMAVAPKTILRNEWGSRPELEADVGEWVPDTDWLPVEGMFGMYAHVSTGEVREWRG